MRIKILLITFIFLLFIDVGVGENQKPEWNVKVEYENGTKVIKNPEEPLYGEITLELEEDLSIGREDDENYFFYKIRDIQVDKTGNIYVLDSGNYRVQKFDEKGNYLLTIGRKGQGPGELNWPIGLRVDDETGNIYVNVGLRKIVIFDKEGNYMDRDINPEENLIDFYLDSDRNIWGKFWWPGYHSLKKVNHQGKVEKTLAKFPFELVNKTVRAERLGNNKVRSLIFTTTHGYEHDLFISKIDNQAFIHACSKDYELNIIDKEGNIIFKIRKDEPYKKITSKEKDEIENGIKMRVMMKGYPIREISLNFPEHMPFFYSIITDCKGRIYVQTKWEDREGKKIRVYDIFSRDGYYLYRTIIPNRPYVIKKGYLYTCIVNEDTVNEFVKRYKIRNWDQIKEVL